MELQTNICDDEVLLAERRESPFRAKRALPGLCAVTILAAAGAGGRAAWNSSQVDHAVSLQGVVVAAACSNDGDDCRSTGCCVRAGNSCYRKNAHWASCNESCSQHRKWSHHHHYWHDTAERVWDCAVLTRQAAPATQPATAAPTTQPATAALVAQPAAPAVATCDDWDVTDDEDRSELEHWRGNPNGDLTDEEYAALAPCFALLDAGKAQPEAQLEAPPAQPVAQAPVVVSPYNPNPAGQPVAQDAVAVNPYNPDPALWASDSYKASGCPEDGHDCRTARCCARRGSKCFVKNHHWASCNETCMPYTHWQGTHGHGSWKHTSHRVWDCTDITTADNTYAPFP